MVILIEHIVKQNNYALFFSNIFLMHFKSQPLFVLQRLPFFLKSKGQFNKMFAADKIAKINISVFLFLSDDIKQ